MKEKNILIVDDSKTMCGILENILNEAGYTNITAVYSGADAIAAYKKNAPDLVLLDIIMPETNGMEVLREIGGDKKVIVLSAIGQESIIAEAKALGAIDYLVKPIERKEMLAKILPHLK